MTVDMTNNRVPYGLLTNEEKAALHEHEEGGGKIEYWCGIWEKVEPTWHHNMIYRTLPLPAQRSEQSSLKTQDVIAWEKLPEWVEWVARDEDGWVWCYRLEPLVCTGVWSSPRAARTRCIDDFPGIVQIGTVDWKDSKQRRPRG
jgi:hypothetical protein